MRKLRILYLYWDLIPSVRLCGHCQLEWLAANGKLEYRHSRIRKIKKADLQWADAVLLGRLDSAAEYQIARQLKKAGKFLIYVIDDDLLNIPAYLSSAGYYTLPEVRSSIQRMLALSDAILSPSPELLKKYAAKLHTAIQIEEPALTPVVFVPHALNRSVRIGFAGSIDRTGDLESLLKEALLQIQRDYGRRVEFEFFGAIPSFAQQLNAYCIPYCDSYDDYRRILNERQWDIGLAPMPDTPFHACKHYNKYVEYAAAGIVGVFSNVAPYTRLDARNANVLFCENNVQSWANAITWLLEHPQEREEMRRALSVRAACELSIDASSTALLNQLQHTVIVGKTKPVFYCLFPFLLLADFQKTVRFIRKHGLQAPVVLLKKIKNRL